MITDKGKEIIAKYLLGTTPAYASYMAFGCGQKPLADNAAAVDYSDKELLDFEMFRVPISSRGYVKEDNVNKIVFTAELPTQERYEITEIGIYSAGGNPSAAGFDSRSLLLFTEEEDWKYLDTTLKTIPSINSALDTNNDNIISTTDSVFQAAADNRIFYKQYRNTTNERCRFLNNMLLVKGNYSDIKTITNVANITPGSNSHNYISKTGLNINLSQNSLSDKIKVAFSLVNKDASAAHAKPGSLKIVLEFINNDKYARCLIDLVDGAGGINFTTNRYFVVEKTLQDFVLQEGFSWESITSARIYSSVVTSSAAVATHYIAFDAIRFDNVSTVNPLYGLVGYTVVKNANAEPIEKSPNTNNYVEFRMSLDIGNVV
jgi:hypothetical protein